MLAVAFSWVARNIQNRGVGDIALGCSFFVVFAALMGLSLRWKLRVDENGLSRRLIRWDLWTWSALESGRIRKLYPYTLFDPERPWWRRRLGLGSMDAGELQDVIAAVNTRYKLPSSPDTPDTLTIQYGYRRTVELHRKGVQLTIRDRRREFLWPDVREVHLLRMDPLRRDFESLVILLPDQEVELRLLTHQGGTSPSWRGATAEVVNQFLFKFVPAGRIHISLAGQPLTKPEQIERKLREARKRVREIRIMIAIFLPMLVGLLVLMALDSGVLKAIVMGAMLLVLAGPVIFFSSRTERKNIVKLKESLSKLER
ncbi:MAG: hypothetical protein AAF492_05780 [Verrucomicrobiota bacterium]